MSSTTLSYTRALVVMIGVTLIWKMALVGIAALAPTFLPLQPTLVFQTDQLPAVLRSWANFDGIHYLTVINLGYPGIGLVQAFFPLYPMIVEAAGVLLNSVHLALIGQVISLVSLAVSLSLLARHHGRLLRQKPSQSLRYWLSAALLLFPTAFFFGAVYTESLFLLLVIGVFLAAGREQWWLAGVLAALASATRVIGIFLVPALMIELAHQTGLFATLNAELGKLVTPDARFKRFFLILGSVTQLKLRWLMAQRGRVAAVSVGSLGLIGYGAYLWYHFGDPLYFFHVQSEFGAGRQETLVLWPQVVWRYLKIMTTVPLDLRYLTYAQECAAGLGGVLILLAGWKIVRPSIWFFSLAAVLLPTMTGTFSSMPRYLLSAPALFLILAWWFTRHPRFGYIWLVISGALLTINAMLFVQGYWVA